MRRKKRFQLQAELRYWKRVLRLMDWKIVADWAPHLESQGINNVNMALKTSTIRIDEDLASNLREAEVTLVHELIHIHLEFIGCKEGKLKWLLMEQSTETLAQAFVDLRHARR